MKIIVPSVGRAGSTLMCDLIGTSMGKEPTAIDDFEKIGQSPDSVIKTHDYFRFEPSYEYRAIYMIDQIENVIASLYHKNKHFLCMHLAHLKIAFGDWLIFKILLKLDHFMGKGSLRKLAFSHLIEGDKFKFKRNIESWKNSKNVMFVYYDELCQNKEKVLQDISAFLGFSLNDFELRQRTTHVESLPEDIRRLIQTHYETV